MKNTIALLFLSLAATAALAQSDSLDTIVVSASRLGVTASELPPAVSVFDRDFIEAIRPASVTELMRQLPGVSVVQQGGRGSITSAIVRGGEPNFTVFLIDGVKVNDPTNTRGGSYDLTNLELDSVERIEVIRGPMSAIYGSDALSGVINIVTRSGTDTLAGTAGVEYGAEGYRRAAVSVGGPAGTSVRYALNGHVTEDGDAVPGNDFRAQGVSGKVEATLPAAAAAGVVFRFVEADSESFPEDSGGPQLAVVRATDERDIREGHIGGYLQVPFREAWQLNLSGSVYDREADELSPGIAPGVFSPVPPNGADTDFRRSQATANIEFSPHESARVLVGAEWQREKGESSGFLDVGFPLPTDFSLERDTQSVFAEGQFRLGEFSAMATLRHDNPDGEDSETTAGAGIVYQMPDRGLSLRANWGQAFKLPSFFALAHPIVGNPDLVSETGTSVDVGGSLQLEPWSTTLSLSVYRNEFENLVDFDPVLFTNVNRSEVTTRGAELAVSTEPLPTLVLTGHLTYAEADIEQSDSRLRSRPRWRGGISALWTVNDAWQLSVNALALDEFFDSSVPTGGLFVDGHVRLDAAATVRLSERWELTAAIDNLTDADYEEAIGFPAAGIRPRLSLRYDF